jgi:hypothetical protein
MTLPAQSVQSAALPAISRAEAARYALLRRLAPSIRHHLVVNLQPIGMIYEVMERRLRAPSPDLAGVHESAQKINGFARAALDSSLDVVTWLAPDEDLTTPVSDGVRECLGLLTTSLTFRGFAVRNEGAPVTGKIRRAAIRSVLTSAILHMTDETSAPADLILISESQRDCAVVTLDLQPTEGEKGFSAEPPYRRLAWSDVEALAAAESVDLMRDGARHVRLALPWARA